MWKVVKMWIMGLLVWELIGLYYKDKKFRDEFNKTDWFGKIKLAVKWVVDLNKKFFEDVWSVDYDGYIDKWVEVVNTNMDMLNDKIDFVKNKLTDINKDKVEPMIVDITDKYDEIRDRIEDLSEDIKYVYEDKLSMIKDKIEHVKVSMRKNKK